MQELRLVAVSEDGTYAVLAVPGRGGRFVLPIDDRLRTVARGQFSRLAQYEIEVENPLRPKEIQDRIRAGETAEEIADAAGIPIDRVRRFEGPVLAEREYRAQEAQRSTVRGHTESGPGPRLGEVVEDRDELDVVAGRGGGDLRQVGQRRDVAGLVAHRHDDGLRLVGDHTGTGIDLHQCAAEGDAAFGKDCQPPPVAHIGTEQVKVGKLWGLPTAASKSSSEYFGAKISSSVWPRRSIVSLMADIPCVICSNGLDYTALWRKG